MSDRKRVNTGATIDKELYQKLKIKSVKLEKGIGELLDEAIEFYLQNKRQWPDDNENEERE